MRRLVGFLAVSLAIGVVAVLVHASRPEDDGRDQTDPESAEAYLQAGLSLERQFDFEGALATFAEAIRLDPYSVEAHLGYQEAKHWLWRGHELASEYHDLRQRWPGSALHQFLYAHASARRNTNWQANAARYDSAIVLDPSFPWSYAFRHQTNTFPDPGDEEATLASLRRCAELAPHVAACWEQLAEFSRRMGNYQSAAAAYERALDADPNWRGRPYMIIGLAETQLMLGNPTGAFETLDRGFSEFSTKTDLKGASQFHADLATRIEISWRQEWPQETESILASYRDQALHALDDISRRADLSLLQAWLLAWRGRMARHRGHEETSLDLLSEAIAASRGIARSNLTAHLQRERCVGLRRLGQLERAREECESAEAIFRATGDSLELRRALHELTHLEDESGRVAEALYRAEEYLAVCRRIGNEGDVFSSLHDLGWVAWRAGEPDRARRALGEMTRIASFEDRWLYEVAEFYEALGDYRGALAFYYRGARDTTASARRAYGNYGRSVLGLSRLHLLLGDIPRALEYGQEYDEYFRSVRDGNLPFPNLAEIYRAQGRAGQAVEYLTGWVSEAERRGSVSLAAHARRELALSYAAAGQPGEAITHLRSILGEYESIDRFWQQGAVLVALGEAYLQTRRPDSAGIFVERAADHAQLTRNAEIAWRVEFLRGRLLEVDGREAQALAAYERAIGGLEALQGRLPSDDLRSWFLEGRLGPYEAAIGLELARADGASLDRAFALAERKKAQALLQLVRSGRPSSGAPSAFPRWRAGIEARLDVARDRLRRELERQADARDQRRTAALMAEIDSLEARFDEVHRELERSALGSRRVEGVTESATPRWLQESVLTGDQALIEYTFTDDQLLAFVVTPDSSAMVRLEVTEGDIRRTVEQLRAPLEALKRGHLNLAQVQWDLDAGSLLHQWLVEPLEGLLADAEVLLVVPEGILWHLPFEALVVHKPPPIAREGPLFQRYERTQFLVDRYAIAYSPSAALLDPELWRGADVQRTTGELLVFADPDPMGPRAMSSGPPGTRPLVVRRLPGTRGEAEALTRHVSGARVLLGADATENAFRDQAPAYRMLHFASHGVVDEQMPLYSGLALTPGSGTDGFLQAYELFDATLGAELVVLSACETGVGQLRAGEGMLTLSRAFMAAGVPSLVASLWIVPDVGLSPLMPEFYRNMRRGVSTAMALREAKLVVKRSRITIGGQAVSLAHPIFWAPFVLVGLPG